MDDDPPIDGVPRAPWWRRRFPLVVAGSVGLVAVVLVAIVLWGGSSGRAVSTDEAARRLGSTTTADGRTAPTTTGVDPGLGLPAPGVYRYVGNGTDALSSPAKQQTEGPEMPATVVHGDAGCWTFRIDYHSNHWQDWEYCVRDGRMVELGGSTYQRWDFGVFVNESTSTFACSSSVTIDPEASPGDVWTQTCASTDPDAPSTSEGPYRFVARESLEVAGRSVPALHFRRERTMSGSQHGTEESDVWFRRSDGLPLRNRRRIEVRTDTIIGEVTYTEDAEFELAEPAPIA